MRAHKLRVSNGVCSLCRLTPARCMEGVSSLRNDRPLRATHQAPPPTNRFAHNHGQVGTKAGVERWRELAGPHGAQDARSGQREPCLLACSCGCRNTPVGSTFVRQGRQ